VSRQQHDHVINPRSTTTATVNTETTVEMAVLQSNCLSAHWAPINSSPTTQLLTTSKTAYPLIYCH